MIEFRKQGNIVIATYVPSMNGIGWLVEALKDGGPQYINKTFSFTLEDRITSDSLLDDESDFEDSIDFLFANLEQEYYKVRKGILNTKCDIYLHQDIKISHKLFVADNDISIMNSIDKLIDEDIYIGGQHPKAIDEQIFSSILNEFPNNYEKKLFARARISSTLKEFFPTIKDAENKFQSYRNKKKSVTGVNLLKTFKEQEIEKYQTIHGKLSSMLKNEIGYNESQWGEEILQIILLVYPKYIHVFRQVQIQTTTLDNRYLDFLLVDSNGNVDILEIKKPFENAIMTKAQYRKNYIPLQELSGTIMQLEKYIFHLNRWAFKGETSLTEKFKAELPTDFKIKITNPNGIIIMGRENNLSQRQKEDFEVVKRKYKNVVDIITYDSLLQRLDLTIQQIKKL